METLKNYGVLEMNIAEMKEVEGENPVIAAIGIVGTVMGIAWGMGFMTGYIFGTVEQLY